MALPSKPIMLSQCVVGVILHVMTSHQQEEEVGANCCRLARGVRKDPLCRQQILPSQWALVQRAGALLSRSHVIVRETWGTFESLGMMEGFLKR